MTILRFDAVLLCVPLCFLAGCFSEPDELTGNPSGTTTEDGEDDTTEGDEDDDTTEGNDASGDEPGTTPGVTTGADTSGEGSTTGFCETTNRSDDPNFEKWNGRGPDGTSTTWAVTAGLGSQAPNGGRGHALRIAPSLGAGTTWTFRQELPGPFSRGDTFEVDIRYRHHSGETPASTIHIELDGLTFVSANINVVPNGEWHEATAILTLPDDEDPGETMSLLISSFDSDQVIDFDFVFVFDECLLR